MYYFYITRIFRFCQRQKTFPVYRQLTVLISSVIFVFKLAGYFCSKSFAVCFCCFKTVFYIYLCIILHRNLHIFRFEFPEITGIRQ